VGNRHLSSVCCFILRTSIVVGPIKLYEDYQSTENQMGTTCNTRVRQEKFVQIVGDWIPLAQDTDRWRAVVNTVMNVPFLQLAGNITSGFVSRYFN
jgi:hypothetical protein